MRRSREATADLLLVCSSGGHLQQLLALRDAWDAYSHVWVTFDKSDARSLLDGERVVYAHWPTNRSLRNLFRNLLVAPVADRVYAQWPELLAAVPKARYAGNVFAPR